MYATAHISVQGKASEGSKNTNISHLNKNFKKSFAIYLISCIQNTDKFMLTCSQFTKTNLHKRTYIKQILLAQIRGKKRNLVLPMNTNLTLLSSMVRAKNDQDQESK